MNINHPYILKLNSHSSELTDIDAFDHIGGFDKDYNNALFNFLTEKSRRHVIRSEYIFDDKIKKVYPNFDFVFDIKQCIKGNCFNQFLNYKKPETQFNYENFICSFNNSDHVGRQLLTSILNNQGVFDPNYSSKNFSCSNDRVTGHLHRMDLTQDEIRFYEKFFINPDFFNDNQYFFGDNISTSQTDHCKNLRFLYSKISQSFLHVVSETMATSYYPFITEKFLYSVVCQGLFLVYGHPNWYQHLEKYYGFKKYDKIFDYSFDSIKNPVKRLLKLVEMIMKFENLSFDDWRDLYLIEQDAINYNHNHYFSGDYLKFLEKFSNV